MRQTRRLRVVLMSCTMPVVEIRIMIRRVSGGQSATLLKTCSRITERPSMTRVRLEQRPSTNSSQRVRWTPSLSPLLSLWCSPASPSPQQLNSCWSTTRTLYFSSILVRERGISGHWTPQKRLRLLIRISTCLTRAPIRLWRTRSRRISRTVQLGS